MRDVSDRFSVSDVEGSVLERSFVVLNWMLPDDTSRRGVSEPGCFSFGVMIPSDGRVEQPIPESVYGLLHLFIYYRLIYKLYNFESSLFYYIFIV